MSERHGLGLPDVSDAPDEAWWSHLLLAWVLHMWVLLRPAVWRCGGAVDGKHGCFIIRLQCGAEKRPQECLCQAAWKVQEVKKSGALEGQVVVVRVHGQTLVVSLVHDDNGCRARRFGNLDLVNEAAIRQRRHICGICIACSLMSSQLPSSTSNSRCGHNSQAAFEIPWVYA